MIKLLNLIIYHLHSFLDTTPFEHCQMPIDSRRMTSDGHRKRIERCQIRNVGNRMCFEHRQMPIDSDRKRFDSRRMTSDGHRKRIGGEKLPFKDIRKPT